MKTASEEAPAARGSLGRGADDDTKRQAATLYETGWSERRLASNFAVPRIKIRKWLDDLRVERRTKAEAAVQRKDWTDHRNSLLAVAGACGSPTCNDPDCRVPPGGCHRAGCSENAAIAVVTSSTRRHVRDHPTKYCSNRCSVIDNRPHEQFKLELDRLRGKGLYDIATVAAELDRAPQTVLYHVHLLGLGQWGAGFGQVFLSKDELKVLRDRIIENPRRPTWIDRRRRAVWQHHRHGDTSRYGVLGAAAGIEAGRAKGGRKRKWAAGKQQEIIRLDREGLSTREIAKQVFGDERFHLRVWRFLNS